MKAKSFLFVTTLISGLVLSASGQRVQEGAPNQREQLIKVNLTDFAIGQYTAAFEKVLNENSTFVVNLGGIGYTVDRRQYWLGDWYDEFGNWDRLSGNLEAEVSGFELTPEYRRFGYIHDGLPEGLYVSMFGQFRNITSVVNETLSADAQSETFGLDYPHEIDHTYKTTTFGAGFNIGYQWMADNGLSIDVYFGPMFRHVSRSYDFGDNLPLGEEAAIDAVEDRMRNNYYPGFGLTDSYIARTGPWIRGGVCVGMGF